MMKQLPFILVWSRLVAGIIILLAGLLKIPAFGVVTTILVVFGLLSDILDGIIARRVGVSTEKLRRLDSSIDQVFWLMVIASLIIVYPAFFAGNLLKIILLAIAEGLTYAISFARFRKEVATHAIASKIWTLTLFATLVQVALTGSSVFWFNACFYIGVVTRMEIIAILIVLRQWTNDVPTFYHAIQLRKGKMIKRSKWFNG